MEVVLLTDAARACTPNLCGFLSQQPKQQKYAGALPIRPLYPYPSVQARVNGE